MKCAEKFKIFRLYSFFLNIFFFYFDLSCGYSVFNKNLLQNFCLVHCPQRRAFGFPFPKNYLCSIAEHRYEMQNWQKCSVEFFCYFSFGPQMIRKSWSSSISYFFCRFFSSSWKDDLWIIVCFGTKKNLGVLINPFLFLPQCVN